MLNTLEISNFKAFTKKVSIRIRPITLFIGRNNIGKSSAIEFLREKNPGQKITSYPCRAKASSPMPPRNPPKIYTSTNLQQATLKTTGARSSTNTQTTSSTSATSNLKPKAIR